MGGADRRGRAARAVRRPHPHRPNDPDNYKQGPAELLAGLERAGGARAVVFPMAEPDGYRAANDAVIAAAAESGGTLTPFCRVDPHDGALAEASGP